MNHVRMYECLAAGRYAEGGRSDQGVLTGRLVIEGRFTVGGPGGDGR